MHYIVTRLIAIRTLSLCLSYISGPKWLLACRAPPSEDNFNMTVLHTAPVAAVIVDPLAFQSAPSYDDAPHP